MFRWLILCRRVGYNTIMTTIRLEEIRRDLSHYLSKVEEGETLVITRNGQPIAEIRPAVTPMEAEGTAPKPRKKQLRPYGLAKGEFVESPDFDDPLPEEFMRYFAG